MPASVLSSDFTGSCDGLLEDISPILLHRHPIAIQALNLMEENPLASYERLAQTLRSISKPEYLTDIKYVLETLSESVCNQAETERQASVLPNSIVNSVDVARKFNDALRDIYNHSDGEILMLARVTISDLLMEQTLPMSEVDSNPWIDGYTQAPDISDDAEITSPGINAMLDEADRQAISKDVARRHQLQANPFIQSALHANQELSGSEKPADVYSTTLVVDGKHVKLLPFNQVDFLAANRNSVGSDEDEPMPFSDIGWIPETLVKSAQMSQDERYSYYDGISIYGDYLKAREAVFKSMTTLFNAARKAKRQAHGYLSDELKGVRISNTEYAKRHSEMKLTLLTRWTSQLHPVYRSFIPFMVLSKDDQAELSQCKRSMSPDWYNVFQVAIRQTIEFSALIEWIERNSHTNGIAAIAIYMKAENEYGIHRTDISANFMINGVGYELNDAIDLFGDEITEQTTSGGLRKHYDERENDYKQYNDETLELLNSAFPATDSNILNTSAYNIGYIQSVLDGATQPQATAFAWWNWRNTMSPEASRAFDWQMSQDGDMKAAWKAFYRICPMKQTERITGISSTGVKLEKRGWVDWQIAFLKLNHNEIDLSNADKLVSNLETSNYNPDFSRALALKLQE